MKVILLAAGRGIRMGGLTDKKPKPLLYIAGKSLIEYQIERLVTAGFKEFVINVSYRANDIVESLGFGEKWGVSIVYSHEGCLALETGGGIKQALPLLSDPFVVVNADIWTDYDYAKIMKINMKDDLGYLVLVENPQHNLSGDYRVELNGYVSIVGDGINYTFSGISCLRKELFDAYNLGYKIKLSNIFEVGIDQGKIFADIYIGEWLDIGTPQRLSELNDSIL